MEARGRLWAGAAIGVLACSTPRAQETSTVGAHAAKPEAERSVSTKETPAPPALPPAPPELQLEVLQERRHIGLSIQNRSTSAQRFAAKVSLVPRGHSGPAPMLELGDAQRCLTLHPGGEQLWPADWGLTLSPSQAPLASLSGRYRFEVASCDDPKARVTSDEFTLPVDYFVGGSTGGK